MAATKSTVDESGLDDPFLEAETFTQDMCTELRLQNLLFQNEKGIDLYGRYWKPAGPPKALVCIVHGFGEYLVSYHVLGTRLAEEGCLAFGHDHMGHGRSSGERATQPRIDNFVEDVLGHVKKMKSYYPKIPVFIVGHSMGGMITLLSAVEEPNTFKGMVLVGPFISMHWTITLPIQRILVLALSKITPNLEVGKIDINDVTADPQMREKIMNDPLWWKGGIKAQMAAAFMHGINKVAATMESINIPMLIIHGEKDMLCNPEGSKRLYAISPVKDKELKIYNRALHHLYMEPKEIREMAVKDTIEWIIKRI